MIKTIRERIIIIVPVTLVLVVTLTCMLLKNGKSDTQDIADVTTQDKIEEVAQTINVSDDEIADYRTQYSQTLSTMKGILIMFETKEECEQFIYEHGDEEKPQSLEIGIIPLLQTDENGNEYHIMNNKTNLCEEFLSLADGEHSQKPIEYMGKYCYLKRISYTDDYTDDEIANNIKMQKATLEVNGYKKAGEE